MINVFPQMKILPWICDSSLFTVSQYVQVFVKPTVNPQMKFSGKKVRYLNIYTQKMIIKKLDRTSGP